jgi:hypothetical protein
LSFPIGKTENGSVFLNPWRELCDGEVCSRAKAEFPEMTVLNIANRLQLVQSLEGNIASVIECWSSYFAILDWTSIFSLPIDIISWIVS